MKRISRNMLAVTAAASMVVLAGCGQGVEDVPALSEIDDLMWESMEAEDSVTLSADLEFIAGDDPMAQQMFGDDASELNIYGALDGSATAVSIGENDLMRVFGQEEALLSADAMFAMFDGQSMGLDDSQQEQLDTAAEEIGDLWIDFSSEMSGSDDDFNLGSLFSGLKEDWQGEEDSDETPIDRNEISDEGTHEVRDEIDVWVYPGEEEGQELVLVADHDAPKFYEISDEEMTMKFTKWGETESPARPDDANVISQEEAQQRIMEAMMSSAFSQ